LKKERSVSGSVREQEVPEAHLGDTYLAECNTCRRWKSVKHKDHRKHEENHFRERGEMEDRERREREMEDREKIKRWRI